MRAFAPCLQVKQYIAVLRSPKTGIRFRVYTTGDSAFYLFDPLDEDGCSRCKPEYRRALACGWGNSL